jgi:ammonium transporter, Amt family
VQESFNQLWMLVCVLLMLTLQTGFLLINSGRVRAKNAVSVAHKNVAALAVAWISFALAGYMVMYGVAPPLVSHGLVSSSASSDAVLPFLYQLGFCSVVASVIAGGVAERMSLRAFLCLTLFSSVIVFPLAGRWTWSEPGFNITAAWLSSLGFVDYSGATVVHVVAASIALASITVLGPREGRFDEGGVPVAVSSNNAVISLFGTMLLLMGWIGFVGGARLDSSGPISGAVFNTLVAGLSGALCAMAYGAKVDRGVYSPSRLTSGVIGGLVAVTASANTASTISALVIGSAGGLVAAFGATWLLVNRKVDDPVNVVASHGLAGALGTIAAAFSLGQGQTSIGFVLGHLIVQTVGVVFIAAFAYYATWAFLKALNHVVPLTITHEQELMGMNQSEHGEISSTTLLQRELDHVATIPASMVREFDTSAGDESSQLAHSLNKMVSAHKSATLTLMRSEARFADFALLATDWLFETDHKLNLSYLSAARRTAEEWSGWVGKPFLNLLRFRQETLEKLQNDFNLRKPIVPLEAGFPLADGTTLVVELHGLPLFDSQGEFIGYRGTMNDITVRRAAEQRAVYLARHDELTGLANRRALAEDLADMLKMAEVNGQALVVASMDMDGFKGVNDEYGHPFGDSLLRAMSQRLASAVRDKDRVYRMGGDEFVLVMPGFAIENAGELATARGVEFQRMLSEPYRIEERTLDLGVSIGLAIFPVQGETGNDLLRMADQALYAAKAAGKGCVRAFEPSMDLKARASMSLAVDLKTAIQRQQLYLEYQPIVDSQSGQTVGFEALARWNHPSQGPIAPDVFVPIAEKSRLMVEVGRFVLDQACKFAAELSTQDGGSALRVAVNVSPSQFTNSDLPAEVSAVLAKYRLSPTQLELEITEEVLIDNFDQINLQIAKLRSIGVSIAIDDFGSGQSSLRYLTKMPVDKLKIDRSFISQLGNDHRVNDVIKSIVTLGHRLGCLIVAEGVEENAQAALLRLWHCDQVQGFVFSRPKSRQAALQSYGIGRLASAA